MASTDASAVSASIAGQGDDAARVSVLETALWRQLADATDLPTLASPWIALQCALIAGAERGIVALGSEGANVRPLAAWPEGTGSVGFLAAAAAAVDQRRGIVQQAPAGNDSCAGGVYLSYPLQRGEATIGAAVIELGAGVSPDLRRATRQLQWGVAWLRERLLADTIAASERRRRTS